MTATAPATLAADPMGAAGEATPMPAPNAAPAARKPRAKAADDTDQPRRRAVVDAIFTEAKKQAHNDKDGNPLEGDVLFAAQRDVAVKKLLAKAEGKDGIKFKASDFGEIAGGKKTFWHMRMAFYLGKVEDCKAKIEGRASSDPTAMAKKALKMNAELEKLKAALRASGIDPDDVLSAAA